MLLLPFQNSETALGVFTPVDHESSPGSTSHKHKVFRCGHLKALVTDNIMVRSGEAEARPHHIHPEQKKKAGLFEHRAGSCQYPSCTVDG